MDWCVQITRGEDHWNSEIQGWHRGANVTREETKIESWDSIPGLWQRVLDSTPGWIWYLCCHMSIASGGVRAHLEGVTCSLPPVANPPLVCHLGTAGPRNICSCKSRKEAWTQRVKCRGCTMSVWVAVPFVVGWMVWKRSGSRNGSETEELHERISRAENPDKSYCPQRELLANKHD